MAKIASVFLWASALLTANAAGWFDARIGGYAGWPQDGSDVIVQGQGTWTGTGYATYDIQGKKLDMMSLLTESLDFAPAVQRPVTGSGEMKFSMSVRFSISSWLPPLGDGEDKGAIAAVARDGGATTNYTAAAMVSGTNAWVDLAGPLPTAAREVALEMSLKRENGRSYARYSIDGTVLTYGGNEWIETVDSAQPVSRVSFGGNGSISALAADDPEPVGVAELSIPATPNATVASVTVAGEAVECADGVYTVPRGAVVTVEWTPAPGYAMAFSSATFAIYADKTLDTAECPVAVNVAENIAINEVMASNGDSLATKNGGAELDWVELRNTGDADVDLAGWYMYDDDAKPAKWVKIEGSCIVPAHGFKIVWCDKSYTDWAEGEAYAKFGVGKSGSTLVLAYAQSADAIAARMALPPQMKDISYGLGRREKTLLGKLDAAQWRVGSGEWQAASGPVGMPGAATDGFTVKSYQLNKDACANIPAVEGALASGKYSPLKTLAGVQTIAYKNASAAVSSEFASDYRSVSDLGLADGSTYYAILVEGVVNIPRAGSWTFSVGSDDGFSLEAWNEKYRFQSEFTGAHSYGQTPAIFRVQEPGDYNVRLLYFQGTGGATLDLSVKEGEFESYEDFTLDGFRLAGTAASGITHAGSWAGHVSTDVSAAMLNVTGTLEWKAEFTPGAALSPEDVCRLKVRYADGFTAKVNGTVVASVPAAKARTLAEALAPETFTIPPELLSAGGNLLEITAVNDAAGDNGFFLSAEVSVTKFAEEHVFFRESTPGAQNTAAGYGPASPKVQFSVPHGYKTAAFDLELSCPEDPDGAIYYTLDGTSPTTSSLPYTGPIRIDRTTCIRAAVPKDGCVLQQDASATYLFLDDILAQTRGDVPNGFPTATINSQVMRYGMNQSIVNGADRDRLLRGFTNSISTISLVIDPHNLFDPVEGIYVNAKACDGREWERLTMVEQIDPTDDANGFSTAGGIRIRGAFSRNPQYPKHSLRLFFRNEYGDGPLEFPLFGAEGAGKFKKVDLRTSQNYAWANGTGATYKKDTFVHEVFARDTQRDMGQLYTRSRYYNLFINGHYWGLYQTQERGDEDYAETYNGGDADLYDVIKTSQPGYVTGASEGTIDAWEALWNMAVNEGFSGTHSNNYRRAMGQNPDGSRNPEYPVYLNPTNLMDYIIDFHYMADCDSPAAASKANNLYAVRDRDDNDEGLKSQGFYFLRHDAEHTMGKHADSEYSDDPTLYGTDQKNANFKKLDAFNPAELHYKLCSNPEYRMAFADRFYKHCLAPGGALTAERALARFRSRMAEIDDAIVCESARWATDGQTRQTWLSACSDCFTFINKRMPYMLSQYRNRGWYPSIDVPVAVAPDGGEITNGTTLAASSSAYLRAPSDGTIYYTTDGSDPRLEGGAPSPSAAAFAGAAPTPVTNTTAVFAAGSVWSAYDWGREPLADGSGRAWNAEGYDPATTQGDYAWTTGAGILGFSGEVSAATALSRYANHASSGTQTMTFYFRKTFTVADAATAAAIKTVSGSAIYDDGYIMYINGVEVGRGNIPAGYAVTYETGTNETGTDYIRTPAYGNFSFAVPQGVIHEGENTIAVEVHQCHGTSSDAVWDASLDYSTVTASGAAGGIPVPEEGLALKARVLTSGGEWSALQDVFVKSELPQADVADGLRLAEALTAALNGDDTLDYLVVTNTAAGEIRLDGVKIVAWNAKKNTEAKPSLTYFFPAGTSIRPGESLRIGNLDKLTNSQVGLRIYDADGALVQDVYLDAGWWNGACDETGARFIAKTFGAEAKTHSDWKPSATALVDKLRVLELYTSTAGDGGDTGEFIVLTNLDASAALDLTDVKIVAWNSKKKSEADPSLTITLDAVAIPAGGTLTLDQATYFGNSGKLTNSKVGLKIYDPAEACAQEVEVDAGWWSSACDGTGEYFVALEFGPEVKTVSQWTHKAPAPADWPADPDAEIADTAKPADLGITAGAFATATPAELRQLAKWAKSNGVQYAGAAVNSMSFDADGNPATAFEAAYLLNCAIDEVEEKKAEFRFGRIEPGKVPEITGDFYGTVRILGATTLENGGDWSTANLPAARFYKAILVR